MFGRGDIETRDDFFNFRSQFKDRGDLPRAEFLNSLRHRHHGQSSHETSTTEEAASTTTTTTAWAEKKISGNEIESKTKIKLLNEIFSF